MNREQMIAWLTLEGWSYWWMPPDEDDLMVADGFTKDGQVLGYCIDRYALFGGGVSDAFQYRPMSRLMTADLAVMVAYIQKHDL